MRVDVNNKTLGCAKVQSEEPQPSTKWIVEGTKFIFELKALKLNRGIVIWSEIFLDCIFLDAGNNSRIWVLNVAVVDARHFN